MSGTSSEVERLADDMVRRWRSGERPRAEAYLDRFPELRDSPAAALELIAEELTLRDEAGDPASADELAARFPRWQAQVRALVSCRDALAPRYPVPGESLDGFQLLEVVGRGAHGRVFRATQPALGRRVVLKLTPLAGREHLSLARLQHTHIVPLYSAHEFPARGLRGLVMPDFGGVTLDRHHPAGEAEACRVGACLADALEYAHARGLLHLDVKPTNILIAADGTPMLLDFHLARPPAAAGSSPPAGLGGTPGYAAPEHAAAMRAAGLPLPAALDARTDVFALGRVLIEFLRECHISTGLSDILAKCTAADPRHRYPTAAALADDLRRHAADLPLRGVRNRSVAERWRKWRRRRPLALPLLLLVAVLGCVALGAAARAVRGADRARAAAWVGEEHLAAGRFAEAAEAFRRGEDAVAWRGELWARLRDGRRVADRGRAGDELHAAVERLRPLYAADGLTADQAAAVVEQCSAVWSRREELAAALAGQPDPEREERWRADLLDVAVVLAHALSRAASPGDKSPALAVLDQAERLLGAALVLDLERGLRPGRPPRTAWEHVVAGRAALGANDLDGANANLNRALERQPGSFWANYYAGVCRLRSNRPAEALAAFAACVALAPEGAWCVHNRGLAYAELDRLDLAAADFDRALALDPTLAAAVTGRARVRYRQAAESFAAGDRAAAEQRLRACLADDPHHAAARQLLARLTRP